MTVADPTPTTPAVYTAVPVTDSTPPTPAPAGYPQQEYATPAPGLVPRTNGLAVTSLVLSLVGFNLIAVILGHIALKQIKRTGEGGSGFAIAGLVIGYITLAIIVVTLGIAAILGIVGATGGFGS